MNDGNVTWAGVALAIVTGLPAILAAVVGLLNRRSLQTGNNKTVGEMVTEGHAKLSDEETSYTTH